MTKPISNKKERPASLDRGKMGSECEAVSKPNAIMDKHATKRPACQHIRHVYICKHSQENQPSASIPELNNKQQ
jgi:hypothetical protein